MFLVVAIFDQVSGRSGGEGHGPTERPHPLPMWHLVRGQLGREGIAASWLRSGHQSDPEGQVAIH